MSEIEIHSIDSVYVKASCEPSIAHELSDYFTFKVPGAEFTPSYRNKMWDGRIRLYNQHSQRIYAGLVPYIHLFAEERDYKVVNHAATKLNVEETELRDYIEELKLSVSGKEIEPHEHQFDAIQHALSNRRTLLLSPTASGKSLIIYALMRRWLDENPDEKLLIIVPTISLVSQLYSDFEDYSGLSNWNVPDNVHQIFGGQDKNTHKSVVISTWQSIYKQPKKYFEQFSAVIGDECHQFKSQSLTNIMTKLTDCDFRVGLTGTLDGTKTHKLVIEGLFGSTHRVVSTKQLMDKDLLSKLKIDCIQLKYDDQTCKECKKLKYSEEVDYLVSNPKRNDFIARLAKHAKGNSLVLFNFVEKHGKPLFELIKKNCPDHNVVYVSGETPVEEREAIRKQAEDQNNIIIVASYGTFSTGINIRRLHNVIFASPSKSRIRILQSIGRQLRKSEHKEVAKLYDIADNLSWKSHKNYTLRHFLERIRIYNEEKFSYKMVTIKT
jgi:superfamily II DNA or RNA helicase